MAEEIKLLQKEGDVLHNRSKEEKKQRGSRKASRLPRGRAAVVLLARHPRGEKVCVSDAPPRRPNLPQLTS